MKTFKELLNRRRSIWLTWLLSYVTILLLPILLSIFVYAASSRTLKNEIHQANNALLSQVRESMDNHFQAMERLNFELTWNIRIQDVLYSNKYLNSPNDRAYDLYTVAQDMKQYKSAYTSVDFFYLYMPGTNTVVLPSMVREEEFAFNLLHRRPDYSIEQWQQVVGQLDFKGFVPMVRLNDSGKVTPTVAYVSTYSAGGGDPVATNVIMIDQSRILGTIQNVELFNKGHVLILNNRDEPLLSNSEMNLPADFPYQSLLDTSGFFYYDRGGERYEVWYMKSGKSGLKYVSMIPSSLYWEKATYIRNLTLVSIVISLIGGGLLTTFFLRKNYNPVRRLVQSLSGKAPLNLGKGVNEFRFIQQSIDSTLSQMEQQKQLLRSHFITRLLKGRLDTHIPIEESLATFKMSFVSERFAVILLSIEPTGLYYERIQGLDPEEKRKLLLFIVTNVVEEIAGQNNRGYIAEVGETLACLINFVQTDEEQQRADLRRIAEASQQFLLEHYHMHLTLAISGIHHSYAGITKAYSDALDALEYKLVRGTNEILSYEDIHRQTNDSEVGYYYPLQVEQQLINFVKTGDYEKAKQSLNEIIAQNIYRPGVTVSVPFARCLMLNLVSTLIKTISEIGNLQESFFVQNPKRIERLTTCETIQEMQQQMNDLLRQVCDYTSAKRQQNMQETRKNALNELMERIIAVIERSYKDPNLNISTIGNEFDMKPTYLSKLFKDHTGEALLDYINKYRIMKAKQMIAERGKNVSDVSGCVGFNDVNAFIRTFKKYEGITPGKFKESLQS
ncbi:helix-turn-helix domain-containing protein [Paenibacillus koleovorans]|uniref:helix-turn-helix domain-containing protein n=1 Tax=Paenibacillus koleovorans TaxID=121608 RepID=UPI000FD702AD|nr:helix-turn-helix domain-containing protein [Paenibacillus koleovorans]